MVRVSVRGPKSADSVQCPCRTVAVVLGVRAAVGAIEAVGAVGAAAALRAGGAHVLALQGRYIRRYWAQLQKQPPCRKLLCGDILSDHALPRRLCWNSRIHEIFGWCWVLFSCPNA